MTDNMTLAPGLGKQGCLRRTSAPSKSGPIEPGAFSIPKETPCQANVKYH